MTRSRPVYVACPGCGPRIAQPITRELLGGTTQHDPAGVCTICEGDMCWCGYCWDLAAEVLTERGCSNAVEICEWLQKRSADLDWQDDPVRVEEALR